MPERTDRELEERGLRIAHRLLDVLEAWCERRGPLILKRRDDGGFELWAPESGPPRPTPPSRDD